MLTFWPGELNSHAPATDLLLKLSQNDAESGGDAMKHRFGDLQSVTHGQSSIGPGFVLYDSNAKPCVSFIFRHRQNAEDALSFMREGLIDAVAVEALR